MNKQMYATALAKGIVPIALILATKNPFLIITYYGIVYSTDAIWYFLNKPSKQLALWKKQVAEIERVLELDSIQDGNARRLHNAISLISQENKQDDLRDEYWDVLYMFLHSYLHIHHRRDAATISPLTNVGALYSSFQEMHDRRYKKYTYIDIAQMFEWMRFYTPDYNAYTIHARLREMGHKHTYENVLKTLRNYDANGFSHPLTDDDLLYMGRI